jgi:membrane protein required for colicin V production
MTVFDLFVLALMGASVISGALRGLARALVTGIGLLIGLVFAARGYAAVGAALRAFGFIESTALANACGFLCIVLLALAGGFIAGRFLRGNLRRAHLGWIDRVLGGAFGFVRGIAVCSIFYLALTAFPVRLNSVEEARTAPVLILGAKALARLTSPDVRKRFLDEYKRLTSK